MGISSAYVVKRCGFLREQCVAQLLLNPTPWTAPFVVTMLGEYVVEIVLRIEAALIRADTAAPLADDAVYAAFAGENSAFMATTTRRAISYWNVYYRLRYAQKVDYSALRVLSAIGAAASSQHLS
jgi:hypothetical protein